jgi:hypothetical protein
MERGSTKHNRILDENFGKEEARYSDQEFDTEPSDAPDADVRWEDGQTRGGGAPVGMTFEEVEQRSRLGRYIPMHVLPGGRDDLLVGASELRAPEDVIALLKTLPADDRFATVNEVWGALGHHNEDPRHRP